MMTKISSSLIICGHSAGNFVITDYIPQDMKYSRYFVAMILNHDMGLIN